MSNPWMKFYPANWRSEPKLKMCSLSARGLWIELLCIMHEATPYGHLKIGTVTPTNEQLSRAVGVSLSDVESGLSELSEAGVFSITKGGVIYSRKMVRDEKRKRINEENGKLGGNPSLSKHAKKSGSDNPPLKAKKKEARREKKERPPKSPRGECSFFSEFWSAYPACKRKTDKPKARLLFAKLIEGKHPHIDKTEPEKIISGVKAYAATSPDQEFIPLPTTWLNGERWTVAHLPTESERAKKYGNYV